MIKRSTVESSDNDRMMPKQRWIPRKRSLAVASINVVFQCSEAEKFSVTVSALTSSRYLITIGQEGPDSGSMRMLK